MQIDENITSEERHLINLLKDKNLMEKDQILGETKWLTKNLKAE